MPDYTYKALTQAGEPSQGSVAAPTRRDAIERLVAGGQNVLELGEESSAARAKTAAFGFRRQGIQPAVFTRELATLSTSGVPLVRSLDVLIEQSREPRALEILTDVRESVKGGSTLADALAKHPRVFPKLMSSMVRVGEKGGTLDEVLLQLAELYDREEAVEGEVRAALAYPALVMLLGLASSVLLIAFLVPRLRSLFEGVGESLPAPTRVLLGLSSLITEHGWLLALTVLGLMLAYKCARRSRGVRLLVDRCKLRIPLLGRLIRHMTIARLTRLLGTLTRGGISIVEGIDIVRSAVGNEVIAEAVGEMSEHIRSGESVASIMEKTRVFPPMPIQMIAVGEETGQLHQMLLRVADAYDRKAATETRVVTSLLGPVLILCVAVVVGFIILSMLLPIFQLSSVIR